MVLSSEVNSARDAVNKTINNIDFSCNAEFSQIIDGLQNYYCTSKGQTVIRKLDEIVSDINIKIKELENATNELRSKKVSWNSVSVGGER